MVLFNSLDMLVFFRRFFVFVFFFFALQAKLFCRFFSSVTPDIILVNALASLDSEFGRLGFDSYQLMFGEDFSSFFFFLSTSVHERKYGQEKKEGEGYTQYK